MHTRHLIGLTAFFALFILGCETKMASAPVPADAVVSRQAANLPITEAVQTMNLPYEEAWGTLLLILRQRGLMISSLRAEDGEIVTEWLELRERLCGVHGSEGAVLPCSARYRMRLKPITRAASSFAITYVERCADLPQETLECPHSEAEQLMLRIVGDLRAAAGE